MADLPPWTVWPAALFAPIAVWLLWRLQVLGVELLRWRLGQLLRHQKWLYHTVSWFGTLLHELSHATVLLLSGHGIKQMRVGSESGHVLPRRTRDGPVGFLFFLVAALAPLFGPPLVALLALILLVDGAMVPLSAPGPGLADALEALQGILVEFPRRLVLSVARLDLAQPWHVAALAAILVGIPGSRPSHVKGSRFHGDQDEGDIAIVRKRIRRKPWPLLLALGLVVALYWPLTRYAPRVYWYPFEWLWAVAVTAVVLAAVGALWWTVVAHNGRVRPWVAWLAPALGVAAQVVPRAAGWQWSVVNINLISLGVWVAAVALGRLLASRPDVGRKVARL